MMIRDARPEDAEAACEVLRRSIRELCAEDHRHDPSRLAAWLANKTPDHVRAWSAAPGRSLLLAVEGEAVLAVGAVSDAGEILLNYVSPEARFRGVSRALLRALEQRARARGAKRLTLTSTVTAHRFYGAAGYAEAAAAAAQGPVDGGRPMVKIIGP